MGSIELVRPKVVLVGFIDYCIEEWRELEEVCEIIEVSNGNREDFLRLAHKGGFDDCVALCRSNQYTKFTGPLDSELLDALPRSIGHICNIGSGVDTIDVEACKARCIQVSNTPASASEAVAETVLFLIYGVLRRILVPMNRARQGQWQSECPTGADMRGKTLGLIGAGDIATAVASRAKAFGMRVQYCSHGNKWPSNTLKDDGTKTTFEELIRTSDIISIHTPLTQETHHLLSAKEFEAMKDGVVLINTARGAVVDETALIQAVHNGKIWGVGLDVYSSEPRIPAEIRDDERFLVLPHISTKTQESRRAMEQNMIDNLKEALFSNGRLINSV